MSRSVIESYFTACGSGSAAAIAAHFAPDAVIYDLNLPPVRGSAAIGAFWVRVRTKWQGARWQVDSYLGAADRAAIEWTMTGRLPEQGSAFAVRGAEHYRFVDSAGDTMRIAEIRQYWLFDPRRMDSALREFPYSSFREGTL